MERASKDSVYATWDGKEEAASLKVRNSRRTLFHIMSALDSPSCPLRRQTSANS